VIKKDIRQIVRFFRETAIVFSLYAAGEFFVYFVDTRFPGSVVGMLLLLSALHLKWIKVDDIRLLSSLLLAYMPLFFIPAGVSVMVSYRLMDGFYLQVILIILVSTLLVMGITALSVQHFVRRGR